MNREKVNIIQLLDGVKNGKMTAGEYVCCDDRDITIDVDASGFRVSDETGLDVILLFNEKFELLEMSK